MHDSTSSTLLTLPPKQPYRINNCKFQNSMISFLSELHTTKAYTDVVLHAEGKLLNAHKVVLAAGSSYFNNLFKSLTPPQPRSPTDHCAANLVIALPNVKYKDLERVVKFIYLGYLDIVNSELEGFVDLAKQLGVVGMSDDEEEEPEQDAPPTDPKHNEEVLAALPVQQSPPPPALPVNLPLPDPVDDEDYGEDVESEVQKPNLNAEIAESASPPPPNQFLQVNYTDDDDEDLAGYGLDDEMDEDEENSGDYGLNAGGASSSGNQGFYGNSGTEKPFVCLKCGKTYNSNKSLWRHKKFTCDEKIDFNCTLCGKVFSRSDNLRRHVVVAHS